MTSAVEDSNPSDGDVEGSIVFLTEPTVADFYRMFGTTGDVAQVNAIQRALDKESLTAAADVMTGAMVALVPRTEDASRIVMSDGEPLDQLHLTLFYLGDAADIDDEDRQNILDSVAGFEGSGIVLAEVFAVNVFNPTGNEPCLVLGVSGDELQAAYVAATDAMHEANADTSMSHLPWVPHITLAYLTNEYGPDILESLNVLDVAAERVGPIVFDRIRVAFAGEVHDTMLTPGSGAETASLAFHLGGKHDQSTHGRHTLAEMSSPAEVAAARSLNAGKVPNMNDPGQRAVVIGAMAYGNIGLVGGDKKGVDYSEIPNENTVHEQIHHALHGYPEEQSPGAAFTRAIAASEPGSPTLHRGIQGVSRGEIPSEGAVFELGPTSFSRDRKVAERFSTPRSSPEFGDPHVVRYKLKKGSRSLRVDHVTGHWDWEKEHVTMGRFRVTKRTESRKRLKLRKTGEEHEYTVVELEIEQVDYDTPKTFADPYSIEHPGI
jgi:2'-5' RNA ligase